MPRDDVYPINNRASRDAANFIRRSEIEAAVRTCNSYINSDTTSSRCGCCTRWTIQLRYDDKIEITLAGIPIYLKETSANIFR